MADCSGGQRQPLKTESHNLPHSFSLCGCGVDMIDLSLFSQRILKNWLYKLHKKGSRNIYFFYIRKLSRFSGKFSSTELAQSNIGHKKCLLLTQY